MIIYLAFLMACCALQADEGAISFSTEQMEKASISLTQAKPKQLILTLTTRGKIDLHPDCFAHILPSSSGIAHEAYKVVGDPVQAGEVIAVLESITVAEMKGAYLLAKEKAELAQSLFERETNLYNKRATSRFDYLKAKSAYETAKIDRLLLEQKLEALGFRPNEISSTDNLRLFPIRSPLTGVVLARHMTQGEYIESNAKIFEVANLSKVWVEMGIPPQDLSRIEVGQEVKIRENGQEQIGRLIYVSPIIHDASVATRAIAEIENKNQQWRPGGYVEALITTKKIPVVLSVPKDSIQEIDGQKVVFVKTQEGFVKKQVQIGLSDLHAVEIVKGINNKDQIAANNTFLLKAELGKGADDDDD